MEMIQSGMKYLMRSSVYGPKRISTHKYVTKGS